MSCNGCRVLRKGCSEDCVIRPCLHWIKSPDSQANATLFLAKFYGRAGLINLINAGPVYLRPEIFRSLIFEACGRIIDPVQGSVGIMSSGNWPRVQAAVEAVLQGSPVAMQGQCPLLPLQRCDIRHLAKDSAVTHHRVRTRHCGKRSRSGADSVRAESEAKFTITGWDLREVDQMDFSDHKRPKISPSHNSGSVETVEPELVQQKEHQILEVKREEYLTKIELELTLGLNPPLVHTYPSMVAKTEASRKAKIHYRA